MIDTPMIASIFIERARMMPSGMKAMTALTMMPSVPNMENTIMTSAMSSHSLFFVMRMILVTSASMAPVRSMTANTPPMMRTRKISDSTVSNPLKSGPSKGCMLLSKGGYRCTVPREVDGVKQASSRQKNWEHALFYQADKGIAAEP